MFGSNKTKWPKQDGQNRKGHQHLREKKLKLILITLFRNCKFQYVYLYEYKKSIFSRFDMYCVLFNGQFLHFRPSKKIVTFDYGNCYTFQSQRYISGSSGPIGGNILLLYLEIQLLYYFRSAWVHPRFLVGFVLLVFCVVFCRSLFVLFLSALVLSVLHLTTPFPFGILKLFSITMGCILML